MIFVNFQKYFENSSGIFKNICKSENQIFLKQFFQVHIFVAPLVGVQGVRLNPSILREGFLSPAIFWKDSIEIQYFDKFQLI